ncbi:zona pellucida sperm-binding protein 4-like [Lampris incognitus]|uniref:zona pellucida sperm-binding protein 4-like n=1 Tax=Lampris incognitus TaxID=2546036 RepID=UPI0024B4A146|nr:zona pellucida sperm-binding protein 4-like [Lampris incognitus]
MEVGSPHRGPSLESVTRIHMAWRRIVLPLALTWTLAVSFQDWEPVSEVRGGSGEWRVLNDTQLSGYFEALEWESSGDYSDGDAVAQIEDARTDSGPVAKRGFEVDYMANPPGGQDTVAQRTTSGLEFLCSETDFKITLPVGPLSEVKVLGSKTILPVLDAPDSCGYDVDEIYNTLTVPFSGCHVNQQPDKYILHLLHVSEFGEADVSTLSCDAGLKQRASLASPSRPQVRSPKCNNPTPAPKAQNCHFPHEQRVPCGVGGISSSECEKKGCCVDPATHVCYYPMDECTADEHFVFVIGKDSATIPVDPTKLVIPAKPSCTPVIANYRFAVFKFSVTDCGTRSHVIGNTKIYLAEVHTIIHTLSLKFGIITRSDPLRFMIECRYSKSGQSVASVGYMVKGPSFTLPPKIISDGLFGVELRIAEDGTYTKYFASNHQPLHLLLGKPVYIELNLKTPKPYAVILVNYCLAYPRSAKNALVLVYDGCANPNDPHVSIIKVNNLPQNRHQRRFVVTAFQLMDQHTHNYLNEEIYFMCSTEVCRPAEKLCRESCFDGTVGRT